MADKIRGITIEIGGDTSGLTDSLNKANKSISATNKELKDVERLLKLDPTNTELLAQKMELLHNQAGIAENKIADLQKLEEQMKAEGIDENAEQFRALRREIISTENQASTFYDEYINAQRALNGTGDAAEETGDQMEDLGENVEEATEELEDHAEAADKTEKSYGGLKKAAAAVGAAVAAVGAAVVAGTKKLIDGVAATAEYGDAIDKASQKMGISAEAYQEWDFIAQHSGTTVDAMASSMKKLTQASEGTSKDAVAAFKKLGLSMEDVGQLSQEELFGVVISGLQGLDDESERASIASDLLGKNYTELNALLNTSAEETEAMRQQAHDLGLVMSDESVSAAAAFQDSLQNLQSAISGAKNSAFAEFMPAVTQMMDGLTAVFGGDADSGLGMITSGLQDFTGTLMATIPDVLEAGTEIVTTLLTAVIDAIPLLIPAATDMVMTVTESIIENLPSIIEAGVQIIISLVQGLADSLPELIPAAVDAILTICDSLIDNIGEIIDAALQLMIGLANGLVDALPKLIEKAPVLIQALVDAILENLPLIIDTAITLIVTIAEAIIENLPLLLDAAVDIVFAIAEGIVNAFAIIVEKGKEIVDKVKEGFDQKLEDAKTWGKDLIDNFVSGITEKWENLKTSVAGVAQTVKDFLGFSEPKEGPLSNFSTYAPDMMDLFIKGIRDNTDALQDQLAESFDVSNLGGNVAFNASGIMGGTGSTQPAPIVNVNNDNSGVIAAINGQARNSTVTVEFTGSLAQLGRLLQPVISQEGVRRGASLINA